MLKELIAIYGHRQLIEHPSFSKGILEKGFSIIYEGLISTYPIDEVIEVLCEIYDLEYCKNEYIAQGHILNNYPRAGYIIKETTQNNCERLVFYVGDGTYNIETLNKPLNKYGYFLCFTPQLFLGKWHILKYEKKFDINITDLVHQLDYIYHLAPIKILDKIKRNGITPRKSQRSNFKNEERVYFFQRELNDDEINRWGKRFGGDKDIEDFILLKIDVKKLHPDMRFYKDPRMVDGIYSLEGVPPEAIIF